MRTLFAVLLASVVLAGPASGQVVDELSRRQALAHYRAGQELMYAERYPEAEREFSAAVGLDPLLTLAHYGLGQAFMAQKRYTSAIMAFTGCRDAYGTISSMRQRDAHTSERLIDDEIRELRESISMVRRGVVKNTTEATALQLEKRLEELESMRKDRSGQRFQTPPEVLLALGSAYYRNGQAADAEREWLAAVSANDRLGEAHNNLAVLYMQTGRKQQAQDAVRAAERARFRVHPQLKADIGKMP